MDVVSIIGPMAVAVGGFVVALTTLIRYHRAQRVERTIALHRDLTTGEVNAARERFTTAMWWKGGKHCHQPTWAELNDSPPTPGALSTYEQCFKADSTGFPAEQGHRPLRDLYRVLYCFERIDTALNGNAIDRTLAWRLLGHHAVWWEQLTVNIPEALNDEPGTLHMQSLRSLARWVLEGPTESSVLRPTRVTESEVEALNRWVERDFGPHREAGRP